MEPAADLERRRRRRAQHLLHPGERRQQALRPPRPPQVGQGRPARPPDRGGGCLAQKDRDAGRERAPPRRRRVRHPQRAPRRRAARTRPAPSGPVTEILGRAVADDDARSRRAARPPRGRPTRPGSRSRSAATTPARSASCRRCAAPRSAGRFGDLVARGRARWPPTASSRSRCSARTSTPTAATSRWPPAAPATTCGSGRCSPTCCGRSATVDGIRAGPLHQPAPQGPAPRDDRRPWPRRPPCASTSTCRCSPGSDRMLAAMHRGYTAERYLERLAAARAADRPTWPSPPTSSSASPARPTTTSSARSRSSPRPQYDTAYTFIFSPRPGTEAAAMIDEFVARPSCGERFERLRVVVERARWPGTRRGSVASRRSSSRARARRTPP